MLSVNVPVENLRGIIIPTAEAKRKAWTACYTERTAIILLTNAALKKQADKLKSSTRSSQEHNYGDLHTFIKSEIRKTNKPRKRSKNIPNTWQKTILLQDFGPQVHTVNDFVQFCERLETMVTCAANSGGNL